MKKRSPIIWSLFLLYTLISEDVKRNFFLKAGIEPPSTPLLGLQSTRGSRKKKNVFDGTARKHRRVLHCPVASADEKSRGARPHG